MATIKTNAQCLFGGSSEYYLSARVTYEKNPIDEKITVTIDHIYGYCNVGWDFTTTVTVWLATSKDGDNKKEATGYIYASGSNSYSGKLPKTGYADIKVSKTFNYNSDGSLPRIYIYLKGYCYNVLKLSDGTYKDASTSITKNIGTTDYLDTLDVRKPTISIHKVTQGVEDNKATIEFYADSSYEIDRWKYKIGSKGDEESIDKKDKDTSKHVTKKKLSYSQHKVYVKGRRNYNEKWSDWEDVTFDCRLPSIESLKLTPKSTKKATLEYTTDADYKCEYRLTGPSDSTIDTGWIDSSKKSVSKEITVESNTEKTYTFKLRRNDYPKYVSSKTVKCDTKKPVLTFGDVIIDGTNASVTVNSDVKCTNWQIQLNNRTLDIGDKKNTKTTSLKFSLTGLTPGDGYEIKVTATKVSNNISATVTESNIKANSGLWLNTKKQGYRAAIVYIYDNKQWKIATPYIYDDKKWKNTK